MIYGKAGRIQTVIRQIFPPQCLSCDTMTDAEQGLCGPCWSQTAFLTGTLCDSCAVPLVGEAAPGEILHCDACLGAPPPWNRARAALLYEGNARRLVMALKHGDRHDIAGPAGQWMARAGRDILAGNGVLVPVPLHRFRFFKRTFNQAALLAKDVAKQTGLPLALDDLRRVTATQSLGHLSPEERESVLAGAIAVRPGAEFAGKAAILVDDVMTTGATLRHCTQALLAAGATSVNLLLLARAVRQT